MTCVGEERLRNRLQRRLRTAPISHRGSYSSLVLSRCFMFPFTGPPKPRVKLMRSSDSITGFQLAGKGGVPDLNRVGEILSFSHTFRFISFFVIEVLLLTETVSTYFVHWAMRTRRLQCDNIFKNHYESTQRHNFSQIL